MDYGAFPPEFNSMRMYAGPGAGSMLAASAAWDGLAADMQTAASTYGSVVSGLTTGPWIGPSSAAMAAAAAPYVAWMSATAQQAELAATQAQAAAAAYAEAFAMTVPPPVIAANRAQLMMLVATNFFGQNTPAIAATEAQYAEMWAQDAAAMYGYAANSAAATAPVTPFSAAPVTTNVSGLGAQATAGTQAAGTAASTSGVQSTLSQLMSGISNALQNLASPLTSATSAGSGASSAATITSPFGGLINTSGLSGVETSLAAEYGYLPGLMAMTTAGNAIAPLMNPDVFLPFANMGAAGAAPLGAAGALPGALPGALAPGIAGGFGGGLGGFAGVGQAASVGGLSVPANWGWAATAPPGLVSAAGMPGLAAGAVPLAGDEVAAGLGFPVPFGGLPRAAAVGAGVGAGAVAMKYGPRLKFAARPPAAGYSEEEAVVPTPPPSTPKYPVPATFPSNGHAPPGYQPAVIYVPTNQNAPANV